MGGPERERARKLKRAKTIKQLRRNTNKIRKVDPVARVLVF
jgi:hypothetical protein